jgi:hypothetical protein
MHWGICSEDNFGLFAFWYLKATAPPGGDPFARIPRDVVAGLRDTVDYTATPVGHCDEPSGFRKNTSRASRAPKYRFTGRVLRDGAALPLAMVYAWDKDWGGPYFALTDGDGRFALELHACAPRGGATFYGHTRDERDLVDACPAPRANGVVEVALADFHVAWLPNLPSRAALNPPRQRLRTCLDGDAWTTPTPP